MRRLLPVLLFVMVLLAAACGAEPTPSTLESPVETPSTFESPLGTPSTFESPPGVPNPASKFCEDQGYQLEIRTAADGSQAGYCIFADGTECDEWALFRGECGPGTPKP